MLCLVLTVTMPAGAGAASTPRLSTRTSGSTVHASFDLRAADAPDLERRLDSAQPVSVTWLVDVRREVPRWIDRNRHRTELKVSVRRAPDGAYAIERTVNGRSLGVPVSADRAGAIRHLTSFDSLVLAGAVPRAADTRYRLSVRAVVRGGNARRLATPVLAAAMLEP